MSAELGLRQQVRPAVGSPYAKAAVSALLYVFFCTLYIYMSGRWAAASSATTEQLERIEILKGIGFVLITGVLFFLVTLVRWKTIKRNEETILAQEKSLRISERKSVAAITAASVSHDLNNLLLSLQGLVDGMKDARRDDEYLAVMRESVERGIENLSHLAMRIASSTKQALPDAPEELTIRDAVENMIVFARKHPDLRTCEIRLDPIPSITMWLNTLLFEDAILNLLVNAGQASGAGGRIMVRVRDDGDSVLIEVHDNGPGVPPEQRERIFVPCHTTKPEGTGLGLLAVRAFVDSCHGEIRVDQSEYGGALFAIRIPKQSRSPNNPEAPCLTRA